MANLERRTMITKIKTLKAFWKTITHKKLPWGVVKGLFNSPKVRIAWDRDVEDFFFYGPNCK